MKQAANDATGEASAGVRGRTFDLYGVDFVIPSGQSRDALINAEACLIEGAIDILCPGGLGLGEVADAGQVCAAHLVLTILREVNREAQRPL